MMKILKYPPMGWNSYDCFGNTVTEFEVKANADIMAERLQPYGWEYIVLDAQWYKPINWEEMSDVEGCIHMDEYGRTLPEPSKFPSSKRGNDFTELAAYLHSKGLKFGLHIMRGIPKKAVRENRPIFGSNYRAADIANTNSICDWCPDMYGVDTGKPGAQDWYDSVVGILAKWGVDFIKADDMTYPYSSGEIEMLYNAVSKCGRDIVISLSPGPAPLENVQHLKTNANMWRISADFWDKWEHLLKSFKLCSSWVIHSEQGHWPDADMLPLGKIGIRCGVNGEGGRITRFTPDEQMTMLSLWCMCHSPLMFGGDLQSLDAWTLSVISNSEVLELLKTEQSGSEAIHGEDYRVWTAANGADSYFMAIFNLAEQTADISVALSSLGLEGRFSIRDLWNHSDEGIADEKTSFSVRTHGVGLFRLDKIKRED